MPVFIYKAADRRGQTIDGVMEAADARAVVERLQREAYYPIRVAPHADRVSWFSGATTGRIRQRDLTALTQQLATLGEAGPALAYPAVITTVGAGAVVFLLTFVIPRFATIFSDLGQAIPLPTQILMNVSAWLQSYWWALAGSIGVGFLGWRMWVGTPEGRLQWDIKWV